MILKGSQRGGASNLADHLMNTRENDHVEVADLRGVAARDLHGAFLEIEAISRGTKATQPFFSVSINPPENARLTLDDFKQAAQAIEEKFGLEDQPRAIVTHEKNARLHAHVVWSRIDTDHMRAVELSYSRLKLKDVSKELFLQHGFEMPEGMRDRSKARADNFSPKIWQQAKRLGEDPRDLKRIIGDAFRDADSAKAFQSQLEAQAMQLARGDRRGFVVVHHTGEALPINRYLDMKQKDIRAKLGDPKEQTTIDQARSLLRGRMTAQAEKQLEGLKQRQTVERSKFTDQAMTQRKEHRAARIALKASQEARRATEDLERANRLRTGLGGLWQRFTGEHGRIAKQNADEAEKSAKIYAAEKEILRHHQLDGRAELQNSISAMKEKQLRETNQQRAVLGHWLAMDKDSQREAVKNHVEQIETEKQSWRELREKRQQRSRDKGHEL
ncbi:MAG: relaxase/mobilization nuclease domain-containing protein [Planctomycetaceae bacterium]|nr:relaxase/mobilization nuclease domain-containing protein [Planctomycetaceae bacterium]